MPRRAACIVFVSSQMGHVGAVSRTVYCATKHAVEGLVKAMALELAPRGVRVVSVAPTFVRTAMTAAQLDDPEIGPRLLAQIPLGRSATPRRSRTPSSWLGFAAGGDDDGHEPARRRRLDRALTRSVSPCIARCLKHLTLDYVCIACKTAQARELGERTTVDLATLHTYVAREVTR